MIEYTRADWCIELLNALGNGQPTPFILSFLMAWTKMESTPPGAMFNLLNTELRAPGSTNYNSAGVQNFVSFEQGIAANVWVLNNGLYPTLLGIFRNNDFSSTLIPQVFSELNTWCGGCNYGQAIVNLVASGQVGATDLFPGEKPMSNIEILPFTEFSPDKTEFACGPMGVATIAFATKPGTPPATNTSAAQAWAYKEYAKVNGDDGPSNTNGSSIPNMRVFLLDTQNGSAPNACHFWEMNTVNPQTIAAALKYGYPVIATVTEASVFDIDTQTNPYWWGASGSHIFTIVGEDSTGAFLVFDTAAVERGDGNLQTPKTPLAWPRRYDPNKLVFTGYGCPVQTPWLPAIPSGDPLSWPPIQSPPPPPVDYEREFAQAEWEALMPGLSFTTGIAQMWYADFKRGVYHGPAMTREIHTTDAKGQPIIIQLFPGARAQWLNGVGTFTHYQ